MNPTIETAIEVLRHVHGGESHPDAKAAAAEVAAHVAALELPCIVVGKPAPHDIPAALAATPETRTSANWLALEAYARTLAAS
jgi:hypothetical protein